MTENELSLTHWLFCGIVSTVTYIGRNGLTPHPTFSACCTVSAVSDPLNPSEHDILFNGLKTTITLY